MQTLYLLVLLQIETIFVVIENHGRYPKATHGCSTGVLVMTHVHAGSIVWLANQLVID